ncbi:MAG: S8 family peptidase [Paramuribaculum sp.]|nr:S8 family peptidase [Paramuribaculum sp.]
MKKLLLTAMLLCAGAGIFAQSKLNPTARFMIHQSKMFPSRNSDEVRVSALVKLINGEDISAIRQDGVEILSSRGQFAVISLPLDKAEAISANPAVKAMSFGQEVQPVMDKARPASFVNKLQQGTSNGFFQNYRGDGILLGMMDQGLDPNHINFYNKEKTENRIIALSTITGTNSVRTDYTAPEQILKFGTENASSTHATHVAGIMGGSFNSEGRVAYISGGQALVSTTRKVPYYGVAPEALMYPCVGSLYNENIILAANIFAEKAKALGKPGVFNLSLGYVPGPHDGTDLINEALAEVGKDVIICVAAGNDGTTPLSLQNNFATTPEVKTILTSTSSDGLTWDGEVDTWSDNSNQFSMAFAMIDKSSGEIIAKVNIPDNIPEGEVFYLSNDNKDGATHNTTFAASFSTNSYLYATSEVNSNNNRFNLNILLKLTANNSSKVVPALIYTGSGNTKINSYASNGMTFTDYLNGSPVSGFTAGNPYQSINNIACGKNIIVVGAYMSRANWPVLSSQVMAYTSYSEDQIGEIAPFTSYGNLPDGKTLPEICAPGLGVISSYSNYYVESQDIRDSELAADATTTVNTSDGTARNNPYGCEAGTSMATPYVSGTIALLLEADPTLKVDDVRDLLTATAIGQNQTGTVATQWGAGKLNADDAMRKLLGMTSEIGNINADTNRRFAVSFYPGGVQAIVAGEKSVTARLYSLAGALVASAAGAGDSVNISTESLPKGVYVLTVITPEGVKVSKNLLINAN